MVYTIFEGELFVAALINISPQILCSRSLHLKIFTVIVRLVLATVSIKRLTSDNRTVAGYRSVNGEMSVRSCE